MDEDGEADSLSELYPCSLSCWMMQNLLHQETLSLPDTVLLQDGHLFHWLFTSSNSGSVVKVLLAFWGYIVHCPSGTLFGSNRSSSIQRHMFYVYLLCKLPAKIPPNKPVCFLLAV